VKVGVAFVVITAALGAWIFDLPVAQVTVVGLLASVLVLLLVFVVQMAGVVRHPEPTQRGAPCPSNVVRRQEPASVEASCWSLSFHVLVQAILVG
jgi:hypothetical protein